MNLTPLKRLSSLAFTSLLCTLAVGCGPQDSTEPQPAQGVAAEEIGQVSAAAISCPSGWHNHTVTWPTVGLYYVNTCSNNPGSISSGTEVCMRSAAAAVCNGQGYSDVWRPEWPGYYWSRTEAYNGH